MRKAFTIIELLIVIAVIAILVGIALPRFRGMQEEGLIAQAKGELRTLQTALESYYIHNGNVYPADGALSNVTSSTPTIVNAIPNDPFNPGNAYGYDLSTGTASYYVIYSVGRVGSTTCNSVTVSDAGVVTEADSGCIFVTNGNRDTSP